jgi:hypothetical protein
MKNIVSRIASVASPLLVAAVALTSFSCFADYMLEDLSPHFSTNMPIVWQAPTDQLPKSFWIYKKLPRVFSATTISNAIILASFQAKGFPKLSTNQVILWADRFTGEPQPPNFVILPDEGQLSYSLGDRAPNSPEGIATNRAAVERAWNCLAQLGLDRSQFVETNDTSSGGYGVFLPRQIDGTLAQNGAEGFQIQFGRKWNVQQFCLLWPKLEPERQGEIAGPSQIIACIRAFKTPLVPDNKPDYFARVKHLAEAKKLIITKITPYYGEGVFGETPTNNQPSKIITPFAELETIADFENSNTSVRLFAPILSSEANRLLGR